MIYFLLLETLPLQALQIITLITGNTIKEVILKLETTVKTLFQWFSDNQMKSNPDKCLFLCSSNSEVSLNIENQKNKKQ